MNTNESITPRSNHSNPEGDWEFLTREAKPAPWDQRPERSAHQFWYQQYIDLPFADDPSIPSGHSARSLAKYDHAFTEIIKNINTANRIAAHNPNRTDSTIRESKMLERIARLGIAQYDWLGTSTNNVADMESDGHVVREIGLEINSSKNSPHAIYDQDGTGVPAAYDDVVNRTDNAWEISTPEGHTIPISLDFSTNTGTGEHSATDMMNNRTIAAKKDDFWCQKITVPTHSEIGLPFGCTTITFGYETLGTMHSTDGSTTYQRKGKPKTYHIVPHYTIAIDREPARHAYDTINPHSNTIISPKRLHPVMNRVLQFKMLSQIHEQNKLYLPVLNHAYHLDQAGKPTTPLTRDEIHAANIMSELDGIVQHELRVCMASLFKIGFSQPAAYIKDDERFIRDYNTLVKNLRSKTGEEQFQYFYEYLRDGGIANTSLSPKERVGRDNSYDRCIEMTVQLQEALTEEDNHDLIPLLYGVRRRDHLFPRQKDGSIPKLRLPKDDKYKKAS